MQAANLKETVAVVDINNTMRVHIMRLQDRNNCHWPFPNN